MRCVVAVAVAVAALLACGTAAAQSSPGYAAYQKADSLFVAKKFQECMNAVDEALHLDPKLVPALTLKAKLAMAIRRYDVARESLERALAADPSSSYAQFLYGLQFYQQNELPAAIPALEKARRLNPRDPRAPLFLGLSQESLGRTAEALQSYRDAIRLGEASGKLDADTLLVCSRLLLLLGDFEECGRLVQRALKLQPNSRDPHFEAARLLLKKGDAAKAAGEAELALGYPGDVTDRQVHFLLVQAYQESGREQEAAQHAAAIRALEDVGRK